MCYQMSTFVYAPPLNDLCQNIKFHSNQNPIDSSKYYFPLTVCHLKYKEIFTI